MFAKWFTTPQEQKRSDIEYTKKMFPLGSEQQIWEDEIFDELFSKNRIQSIKYIYLIRKEMIIDEENDNDYYQTCLHNMNITNEEKDLIEYLINVELSVKSLDELPSTEEIKKGYSER